jgi:hypothetical protein
MLKNNQSRKNIRKDYPNDNMRPLNGDGGITRKEAEDYFNASSVTTVVQSGWKRAIPDYSFNLE